MKWLTAFTLFLLPVVAHAQFGPIVPEACRSCPCGFGGVLAIIQNLVNFAIGLAIIVMTLILVWGGILYITSPANPENRSKANKMLINAVVGLLITLSAWLVVDFVMKTLYGGEFGPWNSILLQGEGASCIEAQDTTPLFDGSITATPGTGTGIVTSGNIQQRICSAAAAYQGQNTSAGPANGALACAWAVNNVLRNANVSSVDGNSVRDMESVMRSGRGSQVSQGTAVCGDIVLVTGSSNHVGICMNTGCTQVLSNSSGRRSFSWQSGPTFAPSYNDPNFRIYRVTR